jgi:hypothetical protein
MQRSLNLKVKYREPVSTAQRVGAHGWGRRQSRWLQAAECSANE